MQAPDVLTEKAMFEPLDVVMWKKCYRHDGNEVVVMMEAEGMKEGNVDKFEFIADSVTVLAIYDMWGYKTGFKTAISPLRHNFVYEVGKKLKGPIWGFDTFEKAQRKWVGIEYYGASKDDRYVGLATSGGRKLL